VSKKKNKSQQSSVADRQMEHSLEEAGGRVTAPNRLDEILKKAAAESQPQAAGFSSGKLWAAALLFLGVTATITAGVMKGGEDPDKSKSVQFNFDPNANASNPFESVFNQQDPKPKPGKQDPKPNRRKPAKEQGKDKPKKDLPKGTDPADLKLLRSAEKMLEAEKNLKEMIKKGRIAGVDQVLPFEEISKWKYTEALEGMPKKVKALDGKKVLMLGFMLPIDEVQNIKEFLLVESLWSCCYGQPPDINGIVRCVMPDDKRLDYQFDPLKLVGTFEVEATMMDGYCVDIYQLNVDYVEVIDGAKPKEEKKPAPEKKEGQKKVGQKKVGQKKVGK